MPSNCWVVTWWLADDTHIECSHAGESCVHVRDNRGVTAVTAVRSSLFWQGQTLVLLARGVNEARAV